LGRASREAVECAHWKEDGIMMRRATLAAALALLVTACGGSEKVVVDKYFGAVVQRDNGTLSSFATVNFDKKIENWKIVQTAEIVEAPAPLPDLVQKAKEADQAVVKNRRDLSNFNLDHTTEVDQVKEARKSGKTPPAKLQTVADTYEKFLQADKELRKALADAKDKVEKERQAVTLSVGNVEGLDALPGTVATRQLELMLTIAGQQQPYVMILRRYNLQVPTGRRVMSRWIVAALDPKK
jgi:hypothetical protein